MPETEKPKSEKPEGRPIDDGYMSPPRKKREDLPVVSRSSHYS